MKLDSLINVFTLYESYIEHNVELLIILFYPQSSFHLLNAIAIDVPTKTEKSKVLHSFNVLTTKKQPVANLIDGNVQLNFLSHIPDNFQGVTEIVLTICQNHQESTL